MATAKRLDDPEPTITLGQIVRQYRAAARRLKIGRGAGPAEGSRADAGPVEVVDVATRLGRRGPREG